MSEYEYEIADVPCIWCGHKASDHDVEAECWICLCGSGEPDDPQGVPMTADQLAVEAMSENASNPFPRSDYDRAIAAIESSWDRQCCGNRNEDACGSCRAYADAIRSVEWARDHEPEETTR